jgi:O-antigen/teichoic acid export membrane protein
MTALFPVFVRIARVSLFDLGQKGIRIMANLATLFLPFVAIFIILAKPLIETLFGAQYLPMIPTLTFLCLSTLFTFSNIILIGISVTSSRQGALVYSYIWGVVINILLNITFIYNLGVLGSALAVIVTQAVILMISIYKLSVGTLSHWMRAHILHLFFFPSILLLSLISHTKQSTSLLVGMWVLYVSFLILSKKNRHELRAIMHEMSGNYSRLKSR